MTNEKEVLKSVKSDTRSEVQKDLEVHKKSIEDGTPLSMIREKEVGLKKHILEMQIKADKIIDKAKQDAASEKERALAAGEKDADIYLKAEIAKIEKEAQKIKSDSESQIKSVSETGLKNLDNVIGQLKKILMSDPS